MNADDIARAAQLASALEVSGHPKPGNVHRTADLKEATFEQFVASSVAIGPALRDVAERGFRAGRGEIRFSEIGVGWAIKRAIEDTMRWQKNGNTNLGTVMLLAPLAAAAGVTSAKGKKIALRELRMNLSKVIKMTTSEDTINLYDAIQVANPGGLGRVTELDVQDVMSKKRINDEKISLYQVMKISSSWDNISKEWTTDMRITFSFGYPLIKGLYSRTKSINTTVVQTFLHILSKYPDTFVQRIHGRKVAVDISKKASMIIRGGGILTTEGRRLINKFDEDLRNRRINPGTAADIVASSLMLSILGGLRP